MGFMGPPCAPKAGRCPREPSLPRRPAQYTFLGEGRGIPGAGQSPGAVALDTLRPGAGTAGPIAMATPNGGGERSCGGGCEPASASSPALPRLSVAVGRYRSLAFWVPGRLGHTAMVGVMRPGGKDCQLRRGCTLLGLKRAGGSAWPELRRVCAHCSL